MPLKISCFSLQIQFSDNNVQMVRGQRLTGSMSDWRV